MNRNYFFAFVIVALACLVLIFLSLGREIETPVTKEPPISPPPNAPFKSYISGLGIVEPRSDNIYIGSPVNRLVDQVFVTVGEKVKKDDNLFQLEDRDLRATLKAQQAVYESSIAKLQKLEALPRPEDLAAGLAALRSAQSELDFAKNTYERMLGLPDPRALSQDRKSNLLFNLQQAEAKWQKAQADFDKLKAGTWKPDLEIARFDIQQAEANVNFTKAEIQRTIIQSPINGTVLQIKIHQGESISPNTPAMILGNIDELNLRVSINQLDIPYFHTDAQAVAFLRGDVRKEFPLEFLSIEPFLLHKQNLTNEITETVDTRVLQIIYRIKKADHPLFVGQQMDVFIETNYSS